jgi:uncharacterized membrane protein HdeD (DUF308 family)
MIFVEVWLAFASLCIAGAVYQIVGVSAFNALFFGALSIVIWLIANGIFGAWYLFVEVLAWWHS